MTSREALEFLTEGICNCPQCSKYVECMDLDESESVCENAKFIIIKDLKRLEQLEKENTKLKQALEKACERLDYTCPVEEELIEDLNCEECNSNSEECWVKFFLKEVLKNE